MDQEVEVTETIEQYKARILGLASAQKPLKVQASTPGKIQKLIRGVRARKLTRAPGPGKWSVAEIIAHLADAELVGGYRLRMILTVPGTPIQAYDQNKWAEAGRYSKQNARKSLEMFRTLREANVALMKSLTSEQWSRSGMHAERGEESIKRLSEMYAGHDINHLKQIEAILKGQ